MTTNWREHYKGLEISGDNIDAFDIAHKMMSSIAIEFDVVTSWENEDDEDGTGAPAVAEENLQLMILQIHAAHDSEGKGALRVIARTHGVLPPGLKHGTYDFLFDEVSCRRLPEEIFE